MAKWVELMQSGLPFVFVVAFSIYFFGFPIRIHFNDESPRPPSIIPLKPEGTIVTRDKKQAVGIAFNAVENKQDKQSTTFKHLLKCLYHSHIPDLAHMLRVNPSLYPYIP